MANRDVELRIRARDYSQKPLNAVTRAIEQMSRAQEDQRRAAERGEVSTRDLEASYRKLESAGQQLLKLNSIIEVFKRQNQAMTEAVAKTDRLKQKQAELQAAYNASSTVTAKQERDLARVNKQVDAAVKAQERQSERLRRAAADMQRFGIETTRVGAAQAGIVGSVSRVNDILARQDQIIERNGAAAAQAKIIQGLRQQADQAMATARGYQTLGRVVQQSTNTLGSLGAQIQTIVSPAEAARRTMAGLEREVGKVTAQLARNRKEVTDVAGKVRDLNAANKAMSGIAQQIDMYRQQVATLRSARTEYQRAKADVKNLAQQMRTATSDTGALGIQMQAAQQKLAAAANALRTTGTAARQTQANLRGAGIDTRNLADAEQRLITTSRNSAAALDALAQATNRSGRAARDAGKGFSFFGDSTRTTLSMVQRLRGEVLALTTAYVGFNGAINLAGGAIDAYKTRQQAMVRIGVVVGKDQKAQAKEWEYMTELADALGIEIESIAESYTKFAVSAKAVGLDMNQTKLMFEGVAKAGRVFHLSKDDMNGVFKALEQMLSKGQVYAEELRGQLGERLPGAVAMFAQSTGRTIPEFMKAMEDGKVTGREVVNFAWENAKAIDAQLAAATKGVDAMEARAHNAMNKFKLAVADSGFVESYVRMLESLATFLQSNKGQEAAAKLGEAFSALADGVIWAANNIDTLIDILQVLAGLKIAQMVWGLVKSLKSLMPIIDGLHKVGQAIITMLSTWAARMIAAGGAASALGVTLRVLTRLIPYIGWALLAYDIGAIFYEQSEWFRRQVDLVIRDFKNLGNQLLAIGQSIPAVIYDFCIGIMRPITTLFGDATNLILGWLADVLDMIPVVGKGLGDMVRSAASDLTKEQRSFFESTGQIWDDVDKKWKKLNDDMVANNKRAMSQISDQTAAAVASAQMANAVIKALGGKQGSTQAGFKFATPKEGDLVTKRDREVDALTKSLEKQEEAAKKADVASRKALMSKNLKGRLALIDEEFAPDYKRAAVVGGKEGDAIKKRLDAVVAARKQAETNQYNAHNRGAAGAKKEENALDSLLQKYKELNDAMGIKETKADPNATYEDRLAANLAKVNTQYDELIAKANKLKGGKGGKGAGVAKDFEELRQRNIEYTTTQTKLNEIKLIEDKLNTQQETKKNLLDEINSKRQAGMISEEEAINQATLLYESMNGTIVQTADELGVAAERFKDLMTPDEFSRLMAQIAAVKAASQDLSGTISTMDRAVVQGVLQGMETAIGSIVDELALVVAGTQSIGTAFSALGVTVAKFFADFLQQLAVAILKQMALNALAGWGGGVGAVAQSMGGVVTKHNGGVVGSNTTGGMQSKNGISPALFAGAPRFHSGGFPGLKSDEVPAILQKGEEVLSKDDPKNRLNQSGGGQSSASPQTNRFVLVDDRTKIPEAMNTPEGENAIMVILQRNAATLKSIVGKGR